MNFLVGNKNGIIGFISIIENEVQKQTVFCTFENNVLKKHSSYADLIMQDPKYNSFKLEEENEQIVLLILNEYINNFQTIKDTMGFYWFIDDSIEKRKELEQAFQEVMHKYRSGQIS